MPSKGYSEKRDLIAKSREAMLSAVQVYNNPLISFKTESFIVLSMIAWTYLLHAHYRGQYIDYRYSTGLGKGKRLVRAPDGSVRYWDLTHCLSVGACPLDNDTRNNLRFLVGLRHLIEHKKASGLDSYLSARYQACALNFNHYLKLLHGDKLGLDRHLALSLQFAELDESQADVIKDKEQLIPQGIISYISAFDSSLSPDEIRSDRFAYRLLFTKVLAKRQGQADRVIEFVNPKSDLAESIAKEYWVMKETEKPKLSATQVLQRVREVGFKWFGMHQHTLFWKEHDGKNPDKGFGTMVVKTWYWYENWTAFVIGELEKQRDAALLEPPSPPVST